MRTPSLPGTISRVLFTAALFTIGLTLVPRSAEAQIGVTTYHACYVPGSGTVYRVGGPDTPATCKNPSHVAFQWTDFVRAVEPVIQFTSVAIDPGAIAFGSAVCPVDSIMYTGGFALHSDQLRLLASTPEVNPSSLALRTWTVQVKNEGSLPASFGVYARCVKY
jgi:hypothetical protein